MPELPEVEITRRTIEPLLVGREIADVKTTAPSYFFITPPDVLKKRLRGEALVGLERKGKYLVAEGKDGFRLLLHLGMTGQLFSSRARSVRLLSLAFGHSAAAVCSSRKDSSSQKDLMFAPAD